MERLEEVQGIQVQQSGTAPSATVGGGVVPPAPAAGSSSSSSLSSPSPRAAPPIATGDDELLLAELEQQTLEQAVQQLHKLRRLERDTEARKAVFDAEIKALEAEKDSENAKGEAAFEQNDFDTSETRATKMREQSKTKSMRRKPIR